MVIGDGPLTANHWPSKYVCVYCRLAFTRPRGPDDHPGWDLGWQHNCPNCGRLMYDVGRDFKAPRRLNWRGWRRVKRQVMEVYYG